MRLLIVEDEQKRLFVYNGTKVICVEPTDIITVLPKAEDRWSKSRWNSALKATTVSKFKADGVNYTVLSRIDEENL